MVVLRWYEKKRNEKDPEKVLEDTCCRYFIVSLIQEFNIKVNEWNRQLQDRINKQVNGMFWPGFPFGNPPPVSSFYNRAEFS